MSRTFGRSFGRVVRASRLGFRWWPRIERFVRLRTPFPTGCTVDITDGERFPEARGVEHRCWWEGTPAGDGLLLGSPYLAGLTPTTAPRFATVDLDENGSPA